MLFSLYLYQKTRPVEQPYNGVSSCDFESLCIPPERPRTELRDNTGSRYLTRTVQHPNTISHSTLFQQGRHFAVLETKSNVVRGFNSLSMASSKPLKMNSPGILTSCKDELLAFSSADGLSLIDIEHSTIRSTFEYSNTIHDISCMVELDDIIVSGGDSVLAVDTRSGEFPFHVTNEKARRMIGVNAQQLIGVNENVVSLYDIRNVSQCLFSSKPDDLSGNIISLCKIGNGKIVLANEGNQLRSFSLEEFSSGSYSPLTCDLSFLPQKLTCISAIPSENKEGHILGGFTDGSMLLIADNFTHPSAIISHKFHAHSEPILNIHCDGRKILSNSQHFSCVWHYRKNRHFLNWSEAFLPHSSLLN